jgi:hypothetical protein
LIFIQLIVGATMRHQHAGLAVPDFPLAFGRVWPPADEAFLQTVNARRNDTRDFAPVTAFQIHLHMAHRLLGIAVAAAVMVAAWSCAGRSAGLDPLRLAVFWAGGVGLQILLGRRRSGRTRPPTWRPPMPSSGPAAWCWGRWAPPEWGGGPRREPVRRDGGRHGMRRPLRTVDVKIS